MLNPVTTTFFTLQFTRLGVRVEIEIRRYIFRDFLFQFTEQWKAILKNAG